MPGPLHAVCRGRGRPLLLVHGLGGSNASWDGVTEALAKKRSLVIVDLPGHGASPVEEDSGTFRGLARSLEIFLETEGLEGIDAVGMSLGGRLVLELARRGMVGAAVALDPGGFWRGWERSYFHFSLRLSLALLRLARPWLYWLCRSTLVRSLLLAQLSYRPGALDPALAARELASFAGTSTVPALLRDLAYGPAQAGPAAANVSPVVIAWGRHDRLCLPVQAGRALQAFPGATLRRLKSCGHYPIWDQPRATVRLILAATRRIPGRDAV